MSISTYQIIWMSLLGLTVVAILLGIVFLIAAIVRWRGPLRKRRLLTSLLCFCAIPLFYGAQWATLYQMSRDHLAQIKQTQKERSDSSSVIKVGDKAPSFSFKTSEGKEFSADDLKGKVVLVNFFAAWCGPCILELPHVEEIYKANRDNPDFIAIVIGREETEEAVAEFKLKNKFTFPIAADPEQAIYSQFAKELIPRTYLIGRDGTIYFATTGFYEDDIVDLKKELAKQLQSK